MPGLNVLALIIFILLNIITNSLSKQDQKKINITLRQICISLFVLNFFKYLLYPITGNGIRLPIEFSSLSYFWVPIIFLTEWKQAYCFASYSALLSGLSYYIVVILAGSSIYGSFSPNYLLVTMLCHGLLFLYGSVTVRSYSFSKYQIMLILPFLILIGLRSQIISNLLNLNEPAFIFMLIEGTFLPKLFIQQNYLLYLIGVISFLTLSLIIFYGINTHFLKKRNNNGLRTD